MFNLHSWLFNANGVWPTADKYILLIFKITYLGLKVFFWISLGKKKKLILNLNTSPSLYLFRCLYKIRRTLGFSVTSQVKLHVPKYGYRVYCPININKEDFDNMTVREDEIIDHFRLRRGDIVVDVGAHIGRYTLIAAKRVGLNGKVVAIEANPDNFEMLSSNIKLNQLTNVTSLNYAVYSQETKVKLYLAGGGSGQTIYNTIMTGRASEGKEKYIEVDAKTLDYLLQSQGITRVNWIKIDVEGAELEVLRGATEIISNSDDMSLLIEVHNISGINTTLYEPIMEFLSKHNFKISFELTHHSGEKHVIARRQRYKR